MVFNSFTFLVFFTLFALVYFGMKGKLQLWWLLVGSIVFCAFYSLKGLGILSALIICNYFTGIWIEKTIKKNAVLLLSCIVNLGALFIFKYYNFFNLEFSSFLNGIGIHNPLPVLHLLVPVGLSYFILQAIGYNVDIQREMEPAEKNFLVFTTYFLYFPKLIQGPVDRPRNIFPQLYESKKFDYNRVVSGLKLIAWGLIKKLVIADRLSIVVSQVYDHTEQYSGIILLVAGLFYMVQLYADFSGYMDIALGVSQILGIEIMQNFNRPFAATSVTDFWKRWHISLSTWLYEYVYNPISLQWRNLGNWGMVFAIFITFFLSGLWHGVGWTFMTWGLINGLAMGYELRTAKWRKKFFKKMSPLSAKYLTMTITFIFTLLSFTFVRANTVSEGWYVITHLLDQSKLVSFYSLGLDPLNFILACCGVLLLLILQFYQPKINFSQALTSKPAFIRWSVYGLIALVILNLGILGGKGFIYAQF
ncbi:MAG: MBOAT family protein [Bacteroidetes bacterium]|nr:MBOAT family protein [Bacteroidota bacterium]